MCFCVPIQVQQERINDYCRRYNSPGGWHIPTSDKDILQFRRHLLFDDKRKIVFCFIPKVIIIGIHAFHTFKLAWHCCCQLQFCCRCPTSFLLYLSCIVRNNMTDIALYVERACLNSRHCNLQSVAIAWEEVSTLKLH